MTDDDFLHAFEACSFTRPEWTHEAHVRMAWLHVTQLPLPEALEAIRTGIQRLNASFGNRDGYHETITVAFTRLIASRVRPSECYASFHNRNPELLDRALLALLRHYSKTLLWSPEARRRFVEPDLEMLPVILSPERACSATVRAG